ncbi:iron-containing redox enzyme family protein [Oscillatoria sp. FACHB-1407]|uniref:iron-containing redox enzyme family protein n=1 Tax=Oscillatoria sp. FACHB-1407 TaxID=2692847 RepID=UPI001687104E|nr:iron-containing redox enzyme family protein [Oscillatoria sp. FACHB-1407]MBD2460507.1 iron-containing redox enzyme family protein [Oscillatoria sp. FACHB-1407]
MQSNLVKPLGLDSNISVIPANQQSLTPYDEAELIFANLIELDGLDARLHLYSSEVRYFETALGLALKEAYQQPQGSEAAHRFVQRVLYRINRLNLFWYDDLSHYTNERSPYLHQIREQIEQVWQAWELQQMDVDALKSLDVKQALSDRGAADLNPPLSAEGRYIQEQMSHEGYRYLLAIASFDGLVEASRLSRILGGAANEVQATLTKVLLEEYGNGRLSRKHSTFFAQMMSELNLSTQPEAYFDLVPWQVLASINHNFLLTECKRHFLRYNGGLAYFEVVGPSIYRTYLTAAQRLGLSEGAMGYWDLHIREDERHGRWMIDNVVLPLVDMYPKQAWQIVLGYDQEKFMGDRAGVAVVQVIQRGEQTAPLPVITPR